MPEQGRERVNVTLKGKPRYVRLKGGRYKVDRQTGNGHLKIDMQLQPEDGGQNATLDDNQSARNDSDSA